LLVGWAKKGSGEWEKTLLPIDFLLPVRGKVKGEKEEKFL
jgi:hypothetical protein